MKVSGDVIGQIVSVGFQLITTEMERRANKKLAEMDNDEALKHLKDVGEAFHSKSMAEMESDVHGGGEV